MKRQLWIDILKLIACIVVFFSHFRIMFKAIVPQTDLFFAKTPVSALTNGTFAVFIFLFLSAYLLASGVYAKQDFKQLRLAAFKRYPRLVVPILALSVLTFFMVALGLFYSKDYVLVTQNASLPQYFGRSLSFKELLIDSFVKVWWKNDSTFNAPFWMMTILFKGSFFVLLLALITSGSKKRMLIVFGFMAAASVFIDFYTLCFVLGTLMAWLERNTGLFSFLQKHRLVKAVAVGGCVLSLFSQGWNDDIRAFVKRIGIHNDFILSNEFWYTLEVLLLIVSLSVLFHSEKSHTPGRFVTGLTQCSFSVYLVHWPVICSLSCYLYLRLYKTIANANLLIGIIFLVTTVVVALCSWLFYRFAESRFCNAVTKKLCAFFYENE